ncbi:hypothetical protein KJ671_03135 [Patescibacteria group bacterium]|nr:hypothetical protein [Patescibacteria group bacterium]
MKVLLIIIILILLGWFWPVVGFLFYLFAGVLALCLIITTVGAIFFKRKLKQMESMFKDADVSTSGHPRRKQAEVYHCLESDDSSE